jgi:hypothetical protein
LAAPFGIVIGAKKAQLEIEKEFNDSVDCTYITYTEADVLAEYKSSISAKEKVKTYCYCLKNLISKGIFKTRDLVLETNLKPCQSWTDLYLKNQALLIGIIVLVPIVNTILSSLLFFLTTMERNKSVSLNVSSGMWKSFLLQLINTVIKHI